MKNTKQNSCLSAILFLLVSFFTVFIFNGCRKTETISNNQDVKQIEEKFLTLPANSSPGLQRVAYELKKQNDKYHFIPDFVKKNGYPVWEKVLWNKDNSQNRSVTQRSNNNSDTLLFFIPLQQSVGASINSYITCLQPDSNNYIFRYYNKTAIEAVQHVDSAQKKFLENALSIVGYFNKQINNEDTLHVGGIFNEAIYNVAVNFGDGKMGGRNIKASDYWVGVEICVEHILVCPVFYKSSGTNDLDCYTTWYYFWGGGSGSGGGGGNTDQQWWYLDGSGGGGVGGNGGGSGPVFSATVTELTSQLSLTLSQSYWLEQFQPRAVELLNYLQTTTNPDAEIIARENLRMMTDPDYLAFVEQHSNTGNSGQVWWEDVTWLANPNNFNLDIDYQENNQYPELTTQEKLLVAKYPVQAAIIFRNMSRAFAMSDTKFGASPLPDPGRGLNDKKDAFRHAFFQAINTRDVPPRVWPVIIAPSTIVREFGEAHESESPPQLNLEVQMDLFNNERGIDYHHYYTNTSNNDIANDIYMELVYGLLKYLKPVEPTPISGNGINNDFWHINGITKLGKHGINSLTQLVWTNQ